MGDRLTGECLLNVDHLTGTCLHEATVFALGPLPASFAADDSGILEIAFIAGDDFNGRELPAVFSLASDFGAFFSYESLVFFESILCFDIDHVEEPCQAFERGYIGDVVDQEECI